LTGASAAELKQELAVCVAEALKKEPSEVTNPEFRGVGIECTANYYGGGSATIYRRFGKYPARPALTDEERVPQRYVPQKPSRMRKILERL
jgi:hypothetical protein